MVERRTANREVLGSIPLGSPFCFRFPVNIVNGGGLVVERRTANREVLGSIPTRVTVLCP